jgi:hypothetical protein
LHYFAGPDGFLPCSEFVQSLPDFSIRIFVSCKTSVKIKFNY